MNNINIPNNFEFKKNSLSHIKRCFILGNGPTINKFNLYKLKNEFTIGVNRILYTNFQPNIITISDKICFDERNLDLISCSESKLILTPSVMDILLKKRTIEKSRVLKTASLVFPPKVHEYKEIYDEYFNKTSCMHSVVGDLAIPSAIYLGIKNIFLIGIDSYWNINIDDQSHFYNVEKSYKDIALRNALHVKLEMNMFFAKLELLAQNIGVKIFNISPGSAVQAFPKLDAKIVVPGIINTNHRGDIKGKYLVLFDRIFKCVDGLTGDVSTYSFINIENKRYLRHFKGELITSEMSNKDTLLSEDATFYAESGFTNENMVSLVSLNKNLYVTKSPYYEKYKLSDLNGNFDAVKSSFYIFDNIPEAMLEANAYIEKRTKYSFKNILKFKKLSEEVSSMNINNIEIFSSMKNDIVNENKYTKEILSIDNPNSYQNSLYELFNFNYNNAREIVDNYFNKLNITRPPMFSEHYYIFSAISILRKNIKRILEIGTYRGEFTNFLSYIFPQSKIITIDLPSDSELFRQTYNRKSEDVFKKFIEERKKNISKPNIEFIETESFLVPSFKFEKFDLIWIDGSHEYPDVSFDIINSFHLLSQNGYMLCDDIYIGSTLSNRTAAYIALESLNRYKKLNTKYFIKRIFNPQKTDMNTVKFISISKI